MKPILVLVLSLIQYAVLAQQNLFNIPSGDITAKGKVFYQHQLNLYPKKLESKGHFVYGLGSGWDVGLNLVGKGFYFSPDWRIKYNDDPAKGDIYPFLLTTAQKQFRLNNRWDINFGTQFGLNLSDQLSNKEPVYFNYGLGVFYFMGRKSRITGGIYHTNEMFIGDGNNLGVMLGYEIKLSKRWYLMGDWLSGDNDLAVAVIGGMFNATERLQICAGVQIPNPTTPKPLGIVLEVNLLGWDLDL